MLEFKAYANAALDGFMSGLTGRPTQASQAGFNALNAYDYYKKPPQQTLQTPDQTIADADKRAQELKNWSQKPNAFNQKLINQHYGGDTNRFNTEFDKITKNWLGNMDVKQGENFSQYATRNLKLPYGSFN